MTGKIFNNMHAVTVRINQCISYSPQRSCVKVMFLHLSVILLTGVGGLYPGLCLGGSLSGGGALSGRPPYGHMRAVRILLECILVVWGRLRSTKWLFGVQAILPSSLQNLEKDWMRYLIRFALLESTTWVELMHTVHWNIVPQTSNLQISFSKIEDNFTILTDFLHRRRSVNIKAIGSP